MQLGVGKFWSVLSLSGEAGAQLHNAGVSILIDICVIVVLALGRHRAAYATPAIIGDVFLLSQGSQV